MKLFVRVFMCLCVYMWVFAIKIPTKEKERRSRGEKPTTFATFQFDTHENNQMK